MGYTIVRFLTHSVLGLVVLLCLAVTLPKSAFAEIVLTDAAGRQVTLKEPVHRIVTNEALILYELALIDKNPVSKFAGWASPNRIDSGVFKAFEQRFPEIKNIPEIGAVVPAKVSLESLLSVQPDLVVINQWQAGWRELVQQLDAYGVPTIFLDDPRRANFGPDDATIFSLQLLGQATGNEVKADEVISFMREHFETISQRLNGQTKTKKVIVDVHAGDICCYTPGKDNRITQLLDMVHATNIAAPFISGYSGQINIEFVLSENPDIYIGTGSPHLSKLGGLVIGGGISKETARNSLKNVVKANLLDKLSAVQNGNAFSISHQITISALNVIAAECFAKWIHPEIFNDVNPDATLQEINKRFLPVSIEGSFCVAP